MPQHIKIDGEEYTKVSTKKELKHELKRIGFDSVADFEKDTGVEAVSLVGQFFFYMGGEDHGRVFVGRRDGQMWPVHISK